MRTLRGPNYVESGEWRDFKSADGTFKSAIAGPGIDQLTAVSNSLGPVTSEPINTDDTPEAITTLALKPSTVLNGLVIDEAGKPVDAAEVHLLSQLIGSGRITASEPARGDLRSTRLTRLQTSW